MNSEHPCPHCGYDDPDIWEYHREGDHDEDCPNCGEPIRVTVIRETWYEVGLQPEKRTE